MCYQKGKNMLTTIREKAVQALAQELLATAKACDQDAVYDELSVKFPQIFKSRKEVGKIFSRGGAQELALRYLEEAGVTEEELTEESFV